MQNHRRYVKSREPRQLAGNYLPVEQLQDCDPITQVQHLWDEQQYNLRRDPDDPQQRFPLNPTDPAIPCGLVAKSFFNDTYRLFKR